MPQSYYKIWIHVVWSTKERQPLLHQSFRKELFQHLKEKAKQEEIHLSMVNGIDNHVHALISLNPKFALSNVLNSLKGESSHWINSQNFLQVKFAWQRGYSAFSVSESQVSKVRNYIKSQEEHHHRMSYAEELEILLKKHNIQMRESP